MFIYNSTKTIHFHTQQQKLRVAPKGGIRCLQRVLEMTPGSRCLYSQLSLHMLAVYIHTYIQLQRVQTTLCVVSLQLVYNFLYTNRLASVVLTNTAVMYAVR